MSNLLQKNISEGYYEPWGCHQKILAMYRFVKVVELFDVLHEARRTPFSDIYKVHLAHRLRNLPYTYPVARTKRFPEDMVLVNISTGVVAKLLDTMIRAYGSGDDSLYNRTIYEIIQHLSSNDPKGLADAGVCDREAFESYEGLVWFNRQ